MFDVVSNKSSGYSKRTQGYFYCFKPRKSLVLRLYFAMKKVWIYFTTYKYMY